MAPVYRLTQAEANLAGIIWANAPMQSPELVKIAERELGWKRTTTYTILKRLCGKGIFQNDNATVSAIITSEEFLAGQSRRYVEDTFGGSLPKFIASFISGGKLTPEQAVELRRLIDECEGGSKNG